MTPQQRILANNPTDTAAMLRAVAQVAEDAYQVVRAQRLREIADVWDEVAVLLEGEGDERHIHNPK